MGCNSLNPWLIIALAAIPCITTLLGIVLGAAVSAQAHSRRQS